MNSHNQPYSRLYTIIEQSHSSVHGEMNVSMLVFFYTPAGTF